MFDGDRERGGIIVVGLFIDFSLFVSLSIFSLLLVAIAGAILGVGLNSFAKRNHRLDPHGRSKVSVRQ